MSPERPRTPPSPRPGPPPGPLRSLPPGPLPRPRLIATDLDGTLLRRDGTVSPRTVAALAAAEEAGIAVIFVTGRPVRWMDAVSAHVHGHGMAICDNGAALVDLRDGGQRLVEARELPRPNALAAVRALRLAAPGVSFAVERTLGVHHEPRYPPMLRDPVTEVASVEKLLGPPPAYADEPVLKLLAFHPELDPDAFLGLGREVAGEYGEFTRSSPTALLEVSGPGVSKASTLARRCRLLGIPREEVVAFGDMPNDLEMLHWAGTAWAMGNAHPEVLAATRRHTASNEEDGVARVIERMLAGTQPRGRSPRRGRRGCRTAGW